MTIEELDNLRLTVDEWEKAIVPFLTDVRVALAKEASAHIKRGQDILSLVRTPERLLLTIDAKPLKAVLDLYRADVQEKKKAARKASRRKLTKTRRT